MWKQRQKTAGVQQEMEGDMIIFLFVLDRKKKNWL